MPRPTQPPTIRANLLASILGEVMRRGGDADALLRAHIEGVQPIRDPYQEVPLEHYVALFEAAAAMVDDRSFGARIGARLLPEDLGPLGVVFVAAPSLRTALGRLGFFLRAWQGGTSAALEVGRDTADWTYRIDDPALWPRRQDAEFSVAATCALIRTLLHPGWTPVEIHLEHPPAPGLGARDQRALAAIFKAPVLYDQGVNRIVFETRDLDRRTSDSRQAISPYMEQHLRDLMGDAEGAPRYADRVGHLIARRIGRKPVSVPSLAAELGLSPRTLQRRLEQEGVSVRSLVREHLQRLAEPALADGQAPITAIATDLGYADLASFSRAFRRWRGRSPRDWRQGEGG